jgi:hypothetical protein
MEEEGLYAMERELPCGRTDASIMQYGEEGKSQ